jgi:integrase
MNNTAAKLDKLENVQIMEHIQNYFNELNRKNRDYEERDNKNTQRAYEIDIRLYFRLMRGKEKGSELEFLTFNDLVINQDDFEKYIEVLYDLKDKKGNNMYVNKTINRKVTSLKGFIRFLKKKKVLGDLDISYLELIKGEKERKNHYGVLEPEEVLQMAELVLDERGDKGQIKRQLILFAFKTGLRISELMDLTWGSSFIKKGEQWYVCGIGKGNKEFEIKIPNESYEELLQLNLGQKKVFDYSSRRAGDMMDRLRIRMGIKKDRKIVFHSIRKAAGTMMYRMTGDILAAMRFLRHENVTTTQIYLGIMDYEVNDTLFNIDKIPNDLYNSASKGELIEAIKQLPKNMQLILNMKLFEAQRNNN